LPEECIIVVAASLEKGNLANRLVGPPEQFFGNLAGALRRQFEQGVWYFAVRKRTWDRFALMSSTY
jgi:hypothetical protein